MSNLTHEQLVERVALVLKRRNGCDKHEGCETRNVVGGCACRDDARAAIATIAEAIKDPTEAMMEAVDCGGDKKDWLSGRAWKSGYRSMLAAAPEPPANSKGSLDSSGDDSPVGWLFFNPDAGLEFSENHPIESGEVPDAEKVREATSETLLVELLSAWKDWEADRKTLDEYKNAAPDPVKAQLVEALKPFAADSMPSLRRNKIGYDKNGLRRLISDYELANVAARAALSAAEEGDKHKKG